MGQRDLAESWHFLILYQHVSINSLWFLRLVGWMIVFHKALHATWCFFYHGWAASVRIVVLAHTSAVIQPQKNTAKMGKYGCDKQMTWSDVWVMFSSEFKCDSLLWHSGCQVSNWKHVRKTLFMHVFVSRLLLRNSCAWLWLARDAAVREDSLVLCILCQFNSTYLFVINDKSKRFCLKQREIRMLNTQVRTNADISPTDCFFYYYTFVMSLCKIINFIIKIESICYAKLVSLFLTSIFLNIPLSLLLFYFSGNVSYHFITYK